MVASKQRRASGELGSAVEAKEAVEGLDDPLSVGITGDEKDKKYNFRTPRFSRMRLNWANPEDRLIIESARHAVDQRILATFPDVYQVLGDIYEIVRDKEVDANGEIRVDQFGYPIWKRTPEGFFIEDYTRLTHKQMEHFVGLIVTRMFDWEQRASDLWAESMFAKAQFEERFAISFDEPMSGTVDDRRAAANKDAAEERYFAIFVTHLSRRADAMVRSMERLSTRLRDLLVHG